MTKLRAALLLGLIVLATALIAYSRFGLGVYVNEREEPLTDHPDDCEGDLVLASIGDYGSAGPAEAAVATLVAAWNPDFIFTVGDNNYPNGRADTIDRNIGQYYSDFIFPYTGEFGPGGLENRFFPALGNHDWRTSTLEPYTDYFTLPGNERYYDLRKGPIHLFVLDSDPNEPDGFTADSVQADWFYDTIAGSDAPWKLVAVHHAPYSSSAKHGSQPQLQWPFAASGATAVIAGHDHTYERLHADGIPYFVNGLGGSSRYRMARALPESVVRYNEGYGAMRIAASERCINFSFFSDANQLIDSLTLTQ